MKLHRVNAVIARHVYESRRNFDRVVDTLWWPVLDIVMWGFFSIYLTHGKGLQPSFMSMMLGAAILWTMFYSFQRDMAVAFIDDLWCRNLINLFSTPLMLSEYMAGIIVVCILKVMIGLTAASTIAWAAWSFNVLPWLPKFIPYIANLLLLLACDRNRDHGNDLSLLDENPGPGVGVCGPADAGVVHISIRYRRCRSGCRKSRG